MHKYQPTASDRIRIARRKRERARREAERVTAIVNRRMENDIRRMMRDNRAGGF
jgi:hypothetical protein